MVVEQLIFVAPGTRDQNEIQSNHVSWHLISTPSTFNFSLFSFNFSLFFKFIWPTFYFRLNFAFFKHLNPQEQLKYQFNLWGFKENSIYHTTFSWFLINFLSWAMQIFEKYIVDFSSRTYDMNRLRVYILWLIICSVKFDSRVILES